MQGPTIYKVIDPQPFALALRLFGAYMVNGGGATDQGCGFSVLDEDPVWELSARIWIGIFSLIGKSVLRTLLPNQIFFNKWC